MVGSPNMKNAIGVGPLALVGVHEAGRATAADFISRHGRYFAFKLLAVVGGSRDVTVAVSKEQRGQFTLLYDASCRGDQERLPICRR